MEGSRPWTADTKGGFDCAWIVFRRLVALPQREFPANGSKPFFPLEMQAGSIGSFDLHRYSTGAD